MRKADPLSVVPFSCWAPRRDVHRWVTDSMDLEMVSLLMARKKEDGLINTLPVGVLHIVCFFLCCRPHVYEPPSTEVLMSAQIERCVWNQGRRQEGRMAGMEARICGVEQTLEMIQQQMESVLELLSAPPQPTQLNSAGASKKSKN